MIGEDPFPSSQRRGGAKRRGGQFGQIFRSIRPPRLRLALLGASSPPLRGGEYYACDTQSVAYSF